MSLVPLLESAQFSADDQPALAGAVKAYGEVLNTWAGIGNSPGLLGTYLPFLRQLNGPGALEIRVKDLVAVRVAVLNHCRYTASHRCTSALAQGIEVDELAAVADGELAGFTARERLALLLAEEMTVALPDVTVAEGPTGVPASLRDEAQRMFSPAALVELVMCISMWNALSRFHRVMDFELDMPKPPAAVEARL
ncbi:carboxymuconolactone decarboxylase family protein [Streptomyces sp. NPDC089424]|uniref:carboxymuconolactone decarboxylase family protein n=1 Tax=Streptomyces sp. NPDC089424 TaxID=3365917 RepID=UPI0038131AF0